MSKERDELVLRVTNHKQAQAIAMKQIEPRTIGELTALGTTKADCRECGEQFDATTFDDGDDVIVTQVFCDQCATEKEEEAAAREREAMRGRREALFEKCCPPMYQRTNLKKVSPSRLSLIKGYLEERDQFNGLIIQGPTGTQKTRCVWLVIKNLMLFSGVKPVYHSAAELQTLFESSHRENEHKRLCKALRNADLLAIDDLGRERCTAGFQAEFFDLIKNRIEYDRQTLITTQMTKAVIMRRFAETDTATALSRRFNEHFKVVKFRG